MAVFWFQMHQTGPYLNFHENGRNILISLLTFLRNLETHISYRLQESRRLSFELKRTVKTRKHIMPSYFTNDSPVVEHPVYIVEHSVNIVEQPVCIVEHPVNIVEHPVSVVEHRVYIV